MDFQKYKKRIKKKKEKRIQKGTEKNRKPPSGLFKEFQLNIYIILVLAFTSLFFFLFQFVLPVLSQRAALSLSPSLGMRISRDSLLEFYTRKITEWINVCLSVCADAMSIQCLLVVCTARTHTHTFWQSRRPGFLFSLVFPLPPPEPESRTRVLKLSLIVGRWRWCNTVPYIGQSNSMECYSCISEYICTEYIFLLCILIYSHSSSLAIWFSFIWLFVYLLVVQG